MQQCPVRSERRLNRNVASSGRKKYAKPRMSQTYADEIGADGYARDSTLAVVKAKELLGVREAARR